MINIYKDYYIDADDNNFVLRKKILSTRKDTGEVRDKYVPLGYFSSLDRVYSFFIREVERETIMEDTTVTTLVQFISAMNEVIASLTFNIKELEDLKYASKVFESEEE